MNFNEKLEYILQQNKELCDSDGELLKQKIKSLALSFDEELIEALLNDIDTKEHFFKQVGEATIFEYRKLIDFIDDKNFLLDSYTKFSNKVGLTISNKHIKQIDDVILTFPFKDCILEGGQSKEDESRKEIFFNETLAKDEVNRLLDKKIISNATKYYYENNEVKETNDFTFTRDKETNIARGLDEDTITDNLIIKGNNLLALHSLKSNFAGKVKLIYIDPPYNTDNDSFRYNDSFSHSTWLTFMKNRLEISKELLSDNGSIFVQCDDGEQAYLKILMDEIFGRDNFRESIAVKNGSESGVNAINVMRGEQLFKVKEHILYYSKSNVVRFNPIYVKGMKYNNSYRLEVIKENKIYIVKDIYKKLLLEMYSQDTLRGLSDEDKIVFFAKLENYCLEHSDNIYALKTDIQKSGDKFKKFAKENKLKGIVEEFNTADGRINLVYKGGMLSSLSQRIVIEDNKKYYGTLISDFWWDIGATPSSEGLVTFKSAKKPEKLIKRIIELATNENDLVLDYFMGSGTTVAVAKKMKRQYIGIEQMNYIDELSINRLSNVMKNTDEGISKSVNWQGGGEFIYFELSKYNQKFIDDLSVATEDNILYIYKEITEKGFLNYDVELKKIEEHFEKFKALSLKEKQEFLISMLNKNMLYKNLTEINDEALKIDDRTKGINSDFYSIDRV